MPDTRELKSYVWHKDKCFFVSTIERDSSATVEPPVPRYHETLAWVWYWDTKKRGVIVAQDGSGEAFEQHYQICKQLFIHGEVMEETRDA